MSESQYELEAETKLSLAYVLLEALPTIRERDLMILFILLIMAAVALSASSTLPTDSPRRSTF